MKNIFTIICCLLFSFTYGQEQKIYKFYVYLTDARNAPEFIQSKGKMVYTGNDSQMKSFLDGYMISKFERVIDDETYEFSFKWYTVETTSPAFGKELVKRFPDKYWKYEEVIGKLELLYYPNDYGSTNPGTNSGPMIDRSELDYINVQKAWNITKGNGIKIGISDARIKANDTDFVNKISFTSPTPYYQTIAYNQNDPYTFHGTQSAGIAAAQGNNAYGSVGVCYDCTIVATTLGYSDLIKLVQAGAKVINMSWTSATSGYLGEQTLITDLVDDYGVVFVAGAGNVASGQTTSDFLCGCSGNPPVYPPVLDSNLLGDLHYYPASYDGVISVSAINHQYPMANPINPAALAGINPSGLPVYINIRDSFSPSAGGTDTTNLTGLVFNGWPQYGGSPPYMTSPLGRVWALTSNDAVDILAPYAPTIAFWKYAEEGVIAYLGGGTSTATPFVSGTAALMLSANPCLLPDEVDDVIKLSAKDVEAMPLNQNFIGVIGGGKLETGDAVELVDEMKKTNGNAVIDNHIFNRFNFKLERINNKLTIDKIVFKLKNVSNFTAKNSIEVVNSDFSPNSEGSVDLKINTTLEVCPSLPRKISKFSKSVDKTQNDIGNTKLFPNPNKGSFTIVLNNQVQNDISVSIFDVFGKSVFQTIVNGNTFDINIPGLQAGLYLLKLTGNDNYNETLKFIKE